MEHTKASLWDQLSEDWIEQPRSSSSPPPPSPQQRQSSPPSQKAAKHVRAKSRIPRFANRRASVGEPHDRPPALGERSHNIAIRPHSSSPPKAQKATLRQDTVASRPSTGSSGGSIVRHADGSVVRQPNPASPLPEWKQLASRKQDLFSSMGLEDMFKRPDAPVDASPVRKSFSFVDDPESMPSSPPVVTMSLTAPGSSKKIPTVRASLDLHDIEEESDEYGSDHGLEVQAQRKEARQTRDGSAASESSAQKREPPEDDSPRPPRSTSASMTGYELSPVYISKHNTVDGRVDYAAFDPSELPEIGRFVTCERGGHSDDTSFNHRPLSPSASSNALPSESVAPSDSISQIHQRPVSKTYAHLVSRPELSPIVESETKTSGGDGTRANRSSRLELQPSTSQQSSIETVLHAQPTREREQQTLYMLERASSASNLPPDSRVSGARSEKDSIPSKPWPPLSDQLDDGSCIPPIVGRKRKDARYDTRSKSSDPSTIAKREILRPRNPTPAHSSRPTSAGAPEPQKAPKRTSAADELRAHFREDFSRPSGQEAAKARALASEVATFRMRASQPQMGETRKQSFSTQDYLKEAMQIMDMIRARKNVDASSSEQADSDFQDQSELNENMTFTSQSISRPASREGQHPGWRSQALGQVDPQVLSHLKKYEETGDESFLVSSIVRSVRASEQAEALFPEDDSQLSEFPTPIRARRFSDPYPTYEEVTQMESPIKTQTSQQSTGSGQTIATTSTQRARNIKTIAPENVSHLIKDEEAGMRFDTKQKTWVRQHRQKGRPSAGPSSSTGTETDPLNDIPDLSVNEGLEQERSRVFSGPRQPWVLDSSELEQDRSIVHHECGSQHAPDTVPSDPQDVLREHQPQSPITHDQEKEMEFAATKDELDAEEMEILPTVEKSDSLEDRLTAQSPKSRRREHSVLFSSPPVSREYDAQHWTDSTGHYNEDQADAEVSELVRYTDDHQGQNRVSPFRAHRVGRARSLSRVIEQHEISYQEGGPHGRTMSMSLSISTPLPNRRSVTAPAKPVNSAIRHASFLNSLSPLSAFSVNQTDDRHKNSLSLGQSLIRLEPSHRVVKSQSSKATENLVSKLMDVEPDEPYWDFMSQVNLSGNDLETLHALDAFCPRLESLDASRNRLEHLQGVPSGLRHLNLAMNAVSNLTNFGLLANLQYVDLTGNNLSSLDGLTGLVHIRELTVDDNEIESIDGILDLDGLLSLSLRNNKLATVDFGGAALKRLATVNVSGNALTSITGLSDLGALVRLDASGNTISAFLSDDHMRNANGSIKHVDFSGNKMDNLSVAQLPELETLHADDNCLSAIDGVRDHQCLRSISLRNQRLPEGAVIEELSTFSGLRELHLSGTPLPSCLPITTPFLQLQILDISFTGIQALPADFGLLAPNLQLFNMNSNHLKDLRPLDGIVGLRRLHCAGNRIGRLRSLVRVLKNLGRLRDGVLEELDCRGNPVVIGFYHALEHETTSSIGSGKPTHARQRSDDPRHAVDDTLRGTRKLAWTLPDTDVDLDVRHAARLDDDTKMKRRVYELLVGAKCPRLRKLDGLHFEKEAVERKDGVWDMLIGKGVIEKVDGHDA